MESGSDTGLVTIAVVPCEKVPREKARVLDAARDRHNELHDEIVVMVAPGRWREAREAIWSALDERPWVPENVGPHGAQDGDYIRRAYGSI